MWEYLFESWVWSIGGLAVGYMLGRVEREVRDINEKVDKVVEDDDDA